jgi:hypothetical protein
MIYGLMPGKSAKDALREVDKLIKEVLSTTRCGHTDLLWLSSSRQVDGQSEGGNHSRTGCGSNDWVAET